jgi:hypothetical protein
MKTALQMMLNLPGILHSRLAAVVSIATQVDAIDIGVAMIGIGVWWIHPPSSLITVGSLLFLMGILKR